MAACSNINALAKSDMVVERLVGAKPDTLHFRFLHATLPNPYTLASYLYLLTKSYRSFAPVLDPHLASSSPNAKEPLTIRHTSYSLTRSWQEYCGGLGGRQSEDMLSDPRPT